MNKKYRIAIIGMDHIHITQLYNQFNQFAGDRIEWVGYADTTDCSDSFAAFKYKLNFHNEAMNEMRRYDDYHDLLSENIDIALVCTDIRSHADICEETLRLAYIRLLKNLWQQQLETV